MVVVEVINVKEKEEMRAVPRANSKRTPLKMKVVGCAYRGYVAWSLGGYEMFHLIQV